MKITVVYLKYIDNSEGVPALVYKSVPYLIPSNIAGTKHTPKCP